MSVAKGEYTFCKIYISFGYTAINWVIYVSWRVYLRPSCSGSGNMHFVIFTLVLDNCCQQLGDICQLEGVCDSVCPLVSELGNMHFVIY